MSQLIQFDLGLARNELPQILLACIVGVTAAGVGLLFTSLGWICLLAAGLVLVGLGYAVRRAAGTRIVVTDDGLEIRRIGLLGRPFTLYYRDIVCAKRMLSSTRIAIWTFQGQFLWIGPFQDLDFFSSRRKLDEVIRIVCERAHIREGEMPEGAESEATPK